MKIYILVVLLLVVIINTINAQLRHYISKEQALYDIERYIHILDSIHPSLYYYTPRHVVDSVLDEIRNMCIAHLGDSVRADFLCSKLARCNYLWDYHTGLYRYSLVLDSIFLFPRVTCKESGVFFYNEDRRILAINDYPIEKIMDEVHKYFGHEMNIKNILSTISHSTIFMRVVNECGLYSPFRVKIKNADNVVSEFIVKGWDRSKRMPPPYEEEDIPYSFELYPEESIALIRYNSVFWIEDYPAAYKDFTDFFNSCASKNIKYLFLDVSRNHGGYIGQDSIWAPYLNFTDKLYQTKALMRYRSGSVGISWVNQNIQQRNRSKVQKYFNGKIFVYQSFCTTSGGTKFCATMKVTGKAILVGTETGDGLPLTASGSEFQLPFSKAEGNVASMHSFEEFPSLPRTSEGYLLPDIEYPFSWEKRIELQDCLNIIELDKLIKK